MLNRCPDFRAKPLDEKWDLVLSEDLCWVCLRGRHADGQVCFLAQRLANNKKQPCGFIWAATRTTAWFFTRLLRELL